jgi:hypothetical protein
MREIEGRSRMRRRNEERREKMIGVPVTDQEYERVRKLAFDAHKSLAAYVRDIVLSTPKTKHATK